MSGGGGTTQTVQKSDPWSGVQPYLVGNGTSNTQPQYIKQYSPGTYNVAEASYDGGSWIDVPNPAYAPGTPDTGLYGRVAALAQQPQNPLVTQSQNMLLADANNPNSAVNQGQGVFNSTVRGDYLNPETNPYFRASVNDALGMAKSQIAGQYGGFGGKNLSNSGYQENLGRGLGAVATNAYANQYNAERQNQMAALAQIPAMGNLAANQIGQVGQQQRGYEWDQLMKANQIFSGAQGGTTTGQVPYTDNTAAQLAGLGMMAYAAFGASDRRIKSNVKRIGTHPLGIGVYKYEIYGKEEIGVMADEVFEVMPEAVVEMPGGTLGVNYDMIGGRPHG